jgi:hypothetical protein
MESPKKRRKTRNSSTGSSAFLNHPADEELAGVILSFCDFQQLLRIRKLNNFHRQLVEEEILQVSKRTIKSLPIECNSEDRDGGVQAAKLQLGQSELSKAALINKALGFCDPGGQVSEDSDYDGNRARRLLEVTGWVDVEDFYEERDHDYVRLRNMRNSEGMGEVGWNVEIHYKRHIKRLVTAKQKVDDILGVEYDLGGLDAKTLSLRHGVMCLLWSAVQPQSLQYTDVKHTYRHTDYPSGGCETFLFFHTLDDQMIELKGSSFFAVY